MKISVNTTFSYMRFNLNYGSALQAYALQKYLIKRGHDVTLLRDYRMNPMTIIKRLKNIKYFGCFVNKFKTQIKVGQFIKKNMNLSPKRYFSYKQLVKKCPEVDCHIAGSDQIWRDTKNFRYLTYVSADAIKISYAASFGNSKISNDMAETITPYLKRFKSISVREKSGVDIVSKLGLNAEFHIDPTLLLDNTEYPIAENNQKNYCFCYFINLNSINDIPNNAINSIIKKDRLKRITTAPLNYPMFISDTDNTIVFPTIEEWLGYYKNAEYIFTNTYHGLLFSIISKKQFVLFVQKESAENERFYSLLKLLHLEDRIISDFNEEQIYTKLHEKIDYDAVYSIIKEQRKKTDKYFEGLLL